METITSRKNPYIVRLRALGRDAALRRAEREYVCDGEKLLRDALAAGAELTSVLWSTEASPLPAACPVQYAAPPALVEYASPLVHSAGPVFTVAMPEQALPETLHRVIVLEDVQDPGNVGTVLRTANALGTDAVLLTGACADLYSPKTVRSTMGAIFRQPVCTCTAEELAALLQKHRLPLYGAALTETARDLRQLPLGHAAVAVGSEGRGLSPALLRCCDGELIIPMRPGTESLNAAVAAAVIMWEAAGASGDGSVRADV